VETLRSMMSIKRIERTLKGDRHHLCKKRCLCSVFCIFFILFLDFFFIF
jgi:hypothetical protein